MANSMVADVRGCWSKYSGNKDAESLAHNKKNGQRDKAVHGERTVIDEKRGAS
jgi:hypothetical protein